MTANNATRTACTSPMRVSKRSCSVGLLAMIVPFDAPDTSDGVQCVKCNVALCPQKEHIVNIQLGGILLDDLFATIGGTFRLSRGVPGIQNRGPSQLGMRRFRRHHAGLARTTARREKTDRLFFAVRPDPATAGEIAERTRLWRAEHGLTGRPLKPEHFHVTLFHVVDAVGTPPAELVEALAERAAAVAMPAFRAEFDRVLSFRNGAFVLGGDDSVIGLEILQQRLSDALDPSPRPARRFVPHLTLLRDARRIDEKPIEAIGWMAREVVLVHSLLGQTSHRDLARIPLRQA